jgi:hypothetical protein
MMCDVPSTAVFCREAIECWPDVFFQILLLLFTILVAQIIIIIIIISLKFTPEIGPKYCDLRAVITNNFIVQLFFPRNLCL